jgi:NAD(P)-dependent dehydrogenase (short-subunit alcohol dehydrogenase family)
MRDEIDARRWRGERALLGSPPGGDTASRRPARHSARASQLTLLADTSGAGTTLPAGALDADLQQVDLRDRNSWRLTLAGCRRSSSWVHLVNAVAPFVLNARLKPLMLRHRTFDKHIVNVSAMEGRYRVQDGQAPARTWRAALNMMTHVGWTTCRTAST